MRVSARSSATASATEWACSSTRHRRRAGGSQHVYERAHHRPLALAAVADTVSTNQFKNGMHIELDGNVWRIVEFQHVKPGKGGAFVRTKVKNIDTGAVVERTFRAGEKFARIFTETKSVQYLYDDGSEAHFMDEESYEQFSLPHGELDDALPYMQPSTSVQVLVVGGKLSGVSSPCGS